MKSEERHQLQTNVLADQVGNRIEQIKPMLGWFVLAALAITGVVLAWGAVTTLNEQREAAAWNGFYLGALSGDSAQLDPIIEEYPSSTAAMWARQIVADSDLQKGTDALLVDKDEATELINKAITAYEELIADARDANLKLRAQIGLAQAYESLGEIDKATKAWEEVVAGSTSEVFTKQAKARIEWLASADSKAFYTWFSSFKPAAKPQLNLPSDLNSLPTSPDLKLPDLTPFTPPATPSTPATPTAPETPAPATPAPTSETPAATPAPETPAPAAEPPAEPKPAAETPAAPAAEPAAADSPTPAPDAGSGGSK